MKKTILYKTLFFCWAILALTGCDLELQKNYDYEPSVDDPYVKVTAWEYFQDHKDMFSELIAAIEYTGLKDYYTQTDNKNYIHRLQCDKATCSLLSLYHNR